MSWSDGVTKELNDYLESITEVGDKSKEAIMEVVDEYAEIIKSELQRNAPVRSGGLVQSLLKSRCTVRRNWYGYSIEFHGDHPDGTPYQKIANILNFGTSQIQGTRFISKAIRKLKGMDDRIYQRYKNKLPQE